MNSSPVQNTSSVQETAAIRLNNISVVYPNGTIGLDAGSLAFMRGQFAVLLGSSGAGKSTLLRCLNALTRPSEGTVLVEGIGALSGRKAVRAHRRTTAMIFQQHQLIRTQSVLDNVLKGRLGFHSAFRSLFPFSESERRLALECLERVGLLQKALLKVSELSGGEQQRVGIARALVQQPHIVLADEPVASLDPASSEHVLSLLHDICRQDGITAVVSLHQVRLAVAFADRIVGLSQGRVVFDGPPERLSEDQIGRLYQFGTAKMTRYRSVSAASPSTAVSAATN